MKKLLLILFILPLATFAQQRKQLTPTGSVVSISPLSTLTGSGENVMMLDTMVAGTLSKYGNRHFLIASNVTTGVGLSTITINVKIGTSLASPTITLPIASGLNLSLSQSSKPFLIEGDVVNQGNGNAFVYFRISQDGSNPINTVVSYYDKRIVGALDFTSTQYVWITSTVSGVGLGGTTIGIDWAKSNNL